MTATYIFKPVKLAKRLFFLGLLIVDKGRH